MQIISGQSLIFEIWDNVGSHLSTGEYVGNRKTLLCSSVSGQWTFTSMK